MGSQQRLSGLGFEEGGGVGSVAMATSRLLLVVGAGTAGSLALRNPKVAELLNDLSQVVFLGRFSLLTWLSVSRVSF